MWDLKYQQNWNKTEYKMPERLTSDVVGDQMVNIVEIEQKENFVEFEK